MKTRFFAWGHMFPDYRHNSLVNLMSRLGQAFGMASNDYPAFGHSAISDLEDIQHVVLLVLDGLGARYVDTHAGFLQAHKCAELTSVFPSTTATAITTFMTGLAPQQHGLTGWFTYLKEIGAVTAVLPCQVRGSRELLTQRGIDVAALYGHTAIFDHLHAPTTVLAPEWIIDSPYNRAHSGCARRLGYADLNSMLQQLQDLIQDDKRQYIYAYWPEFDRLSHQYGNASRQVESHYRELEAGLSQLAANLRGHNSLILVTADHGFIDTIPEQVIHLDAHPELQDCLSLPLSGEPRVAYCYVHPHKTRSFVDYIHTHFADQMELYESSKLIEQGVFGLGEAHPQLAQRVGDYTLIMKDSYVIKDRLAGEKPFFQHGVHGGTSMQEMLVPLIVLACDDA